MSENKEVKNPLTPQGKRLKNLLEIYNKYLCSVCGGHMIEGRGFYVCTECGLEGEICYNVKEEYSTTETKEQKGKRKERLPGIIPKYKPDLVPVKILRGTKLKLRIHLNGKKRYSWLDEAILNKIEKEEKK